MYIITVYGWEDSAATRIQIGCDEIAQEVKATAEALGYTVDVSIKANIDRSDSEEARATRLIDKVTDIMNGV